MIRAYKALMLAATPLLWLLLLIRAGKGKEDRARIAERRGAAGMPRPAGRLVWFHAASVGEAQSTLSLIQAIQRQSPQTKFLVTSGTVTSAQLMQTRLPESAIHQYYPLDQPLWVKKFLDHWKPDLILWMESEIWPAMLDDIRSRDIPAILVNARLSERSFRRWKMAARRIGILLASFKLFLAQTEEDARYFRELGAQNVVVSDNLKYSADPLPAAARDLESLQTALGTRPVWLYASTHAGEEELACRLHKTLKGKLPGLLTIIVPRHPDRGGAINDIIAAQGLKTRLRTRARNMPQADDDIYIADTLGELGLFYRIAPISCIGRSFSTDGGGGHNPIEAGQLGSAVLHGPHVQNLARIYDDMDKAGAAIRVADEAEFSATLLKLLSDPSALQSVRDKSAVFSKSKAAVLDRVMASLAPWITA